jgi:general secretion pathway protein A
LATALEPMYTAHFGLHKQPFSISPDPRYLYMSGQHQEALAHLLYGIEEDGGFVQLTGEVGTGKTTLTRAFLDQLPKHVDVALILNPRLSSVEFVAAVCDDLQVNYPRTTRSLKVLVDALNAHLLRAHAKGRRTVLVVDEAQNLSPMLLEQIRLLTNLETSTFKLLQIILIGQPELVEILRRQELRQVAQRITARYHLLPLSYKETGDYVRHRLTVAGARRVLFTRLAIAWVHRLSGGVPRLINVVCDRALLGAYTQDKPRVNAWMVLQAAHEVLDRQGRFWQRQPGRLAAGITLLGIIGWVIASNAPIWWHMQSDPEHPTVTAISSDMSAGLPRESTSVHLDSTPSSGSVADLLNDPVRRTDAETAFVHLFALWNQDYSSVIEPTACARAEQLGLRCLHGKGTWNNLRRLDRPATLTLVDEVGEKHYVVLAQLKGEVAHLDVDGQPYRFLLSEIDRYWFGEYVLLWQPIDPSLEVIRPGMSGPTVAWVAQQLDRFDGQGGSIMDLFDEPLKERVMAFQRSHLLEMDGVVGPRTFIKLNTLGENPEIPRLSPPMS